MNVVDCAENKCTKNMLCSASNKEQLVAGAMMKSSDRGDKEMKSDFVDKNHRDRRRERNR